MEVPVNSDTTKLRPFADWLPFVFVICLSAIEFWANVHRREPSSYLVSFIAFIPMAFFFTGLALMRYRKRIEILEQRIAEIEAATSIKA